MNPPLEIRAAFPPRPADAHKRSVGTVAVVGGSPRYPHAPVVAALGARAAGAGLVQLAVPDASRCAAAALVPEATFADPAAGVPPADVTVVGMGLGTDAAAEELVARVLSGGGRLVVDADALTLLARRGGVPACAPAADRALVLTPHEGEAARLLACTPADVKGDRAGAARAIAARYGATVVLKGPHTLVVSPDGRRVYENATGNPAMALGGMGDLLAGVVGARWAYLGGDPFPAAAAAVWLHGAAGDSLVAEGVDPSLVNTARALGGLRVRLDL